MKKIVITVLSLAALLLAPTAQAGPAMCGSHSDPQELPFGYGPGVNYVAACAGDSGPDAATNATAPGVSTDTVGGTEPFDTGTGSYPAGGSYDETQNQPDEDGIQGHDNVTNSYVATPGA